MTSRLLVLAFIAAGSVFATSMDYTLTENNLNSCTGPCQTFEFLFPDWSPYALDEPVPSPGTPIEQLDDIHWTFTDGNPADQLTEQVDYAGSYTAANLAPYLGELGDFEILVTTTDPMPSEVGTVAITFDQHSVPFSTPYNGPLSGGVVTATAGPVAMAESPLPLEMLVLLAGVVFLAKSRRFSSAQ